MAKRFAAAQSGIKKPFGDATQDIGFPPFLLLAERAGDCALRLPRDLSDGSFPLVFEQVFHPQIVGALQLRVAIDFSAFRGARLPALSGAEGFGSL